MKSESDQSDLPAPMLCPSCGSPMNTGYLKAKGHNTSFFRMGGTFGIGLRAGLYWAEETYSFRAAEIDNTSPFCAQACDACKLVLFKYERIETPQFLSRRTRENLMMVLVVIGAIAVSMIALLLSPYFV